MVEVQNTSRVEVLHHQKVACVAPVLHLDLALSRFFHPVREHTSEVLTLSSQNGLVAINGFVLYHENHIGECWIIYDSSHIAYKAIHGLIIDFIFFQFPDV